MITSKYLSMAQIITGQDLFFYGMRIDSSEINLIIFNESLEPNTPLSISTEGQNDLVWRFEKTDDGYYYIINSKSALYLEPANYPITTGTKVIQNPPKGNDNQKWKLLTSGQYTYYVLPKLNDNLYLTNYGANITLSEFSNLNGVIQKWGLSDCFPENSMVKTDKGQSIKISEVKKGQRLISYNQWSRKIEFATVDTLLVHSAKEYSLTKITFINTDFIVAGINNGIFLQEVEATENHPIMTNNGYERIGDLKKGDTIQYYSSLDDKINEGILVSVERNFRKVNEVYNIKFNNGNSYILNSVIASPKCPFVSIKTENSLVEISEILRNQMSPKLELMDKVLIPIKYADKTELIIRIDERKDEVTFFNQIYLQVNEQKIFPAHSDKSSLIGSDDDNYLILNKGDFFDLKFIIPKNLKIETLQLVAKGYYETIEYNHTAR